MKKISIILIITVLFSSYIWGQIGSTCVTADEITTLPFTKQNIATTTNNYNNLPCAGTYLGGNDYVFKFTPTSNAVVNITLSNLSIVGLPSGFVDAGLFVTNLCPDDPGATCISSDSVVGQTGDASVLNLQLNAGSTYYIIVSSKLLSGGFGESIRFDITVNTCSITPIANFTYSPSGLTINFTNTSTDATHYAWLFGDENMPPEYVWSMANTNTNPTHDYSAYGTYTVSMVAYSSCGSTDTVEILVNVVCPIPVPTASFTHTENELTVSFSNTSTSATNYAWYYGDENPPFPNQTSGGDTALNPTHTYNIYHTYQVVLLASNICGVDTAIQNIILACPGNLPVSSFTTASNQLTATVTNTSSDAIHYSWFFGEENPEYPNPAATGDTNISPVHTYLHYGTYNIVLIASNICGADTTIHPIILACPSNPPQSSFTYSENQLAVTFTNNSQYSTLRKWYFGDENPAFPNPQAIGDTTTNPVHNYSIYGTYHVALVSENICGYDTAFQTITLVCPGTLPVSDFTYSVDNRNVTLVNSSQQANTYFWYFGDENPVFPNQTVPRDTNANPQHTYQNNGTYNVVLVSKNLCGYDTLIQAITIDCQSAMVVFNGTDQGEGHYHFHGNTMFTDSIHWIFPPNPYVSGNNTTDINHTFLSSGTFQVILIGYNACGNDTAIQTFDIITEIEKNISGENIHCYPNPTTGKLIISNAENANVKIYNMIGQTMFSADILQKQIVIDMSTYPDGNYFINIINNKEVLIKKITLIK